jgi:protein arginine N-methyltransferase 1
LSLSAWDVLSEHLEYLVDRRRLALFRQAIEATVRPGDRVIDLGCGTGVLGLMSLQSGASHVDAIDSSSALEIARGAFERAGWAGRVNLHANSSFETRLDDRADVGVCDHIGYFGFDYGLLAMLADARKRLLKPGARLIPCSVDLWLAPVCESQADSPVKAWDTIDVPELRWVGTLAANTKHPVRVEATDLLADPVMLRSLDLHSDHDAALCLHAEFTAPRNGRVAGLAGWFDAELAPGVRMNNAPLANESGIERPQALMPLGRVLELQAGERMVIDVVARPEDDCLAWTMAIPSQGVVLRQSSLDAALLSPVTLETARSRPHPKLNRHGLARQTLLSWCDGSLNREELLARASLELGDLFPSEEALRHFVNSTLGGNLQC